MQKDLITEVFQTKGGGLMKGIVLAGGTGSRLIYLALNKYK